MQNQIPKNWQVIRADELCVRVTDGTHDTPTRLSFSNHPLITSKQLKDSVIETTDYFISEKDFSEVNKRSKVDQWDLLFGMIGTVGDMVIVRDLEPQFAIKNVGLFKTGGKKEIAQWLYYYFKSPMGNSYLKSFLRGTSQGYIPLESLRSFPIIIPERLEARRQIISVISAFDDKIEVNNKIAKTLEKMAQALFKEWFVHFHFPGYEKVKFVDSEFGKIPKGWEVGKLSDITVVIMGQSPASKFYNQKGDGLPFHQGVTNFGNRFPTHEIYCTENNRVAEKGDILFSVRAPVGRLNIANTRISLGRGVASIRHKNNYQSYIYYLLKRLFKKEDSLGGGSVFPSVTKNDMEGMKILIPSEEVIEEFEKIVGDMDRKIGLVEEENQKLAALRDLLLPKLMKGEIRV